MIRAILLICLILLAHTMAYEDEVMQERADLGCMTDTECELGIFEEVR